MTQLLRGGDDAWMRTIGGRRFYVLEPRPQDVDIDDIAHALSNLCRFNGHVNFFWSVASHSILVSHMLPDALALYGLLHDASEAYMGDLIRPIKHLPEFEFYRRVEDRMTAAVYAAFGLPPVAPPEVKQADRLALAIEAKRLVRMELLTQEERNSYGTEGWEAADRLYGPMVTDIMPSEARQCFIYRYRQLTSGSKA